MGDTIPFPHPRPPEAQGIDWDKLTAVAGALTALAGATAAIAGAVKAYYEAVAAHQASGALDQEDDGSASTG